MRRTLTLFVGLIAWGALPPLANATLIEIIHTNDLHSQLERGNDPSLGGYAWVKGKIEELKAEAKAQGREAIVLDAGDFLEGGELYLASHGAEVFKAMDAMGYDAVTLGNHDWLMGPSNLDALIAQVNPTFPMLGANFLVDPKLTHLSAAVKPSITLNRAGLKIAILGLTLDNLLFTWAADEGKSRIVSAVDTARKQLKELRSRNDLVIALTHLGFPNEVELAKQTEGIDLIVGGHTHTLVTWPFTFPDRKKRPVLVVQAGRFGEHVGELVLDVNPGQPPRIVSYRLHDVRKRDVQPDARVAQAVAHARAELEQQYGASWLKTPVAESDYRLEAAMYGETIWGDFVPKALLEATGADFAVDSAHFSGITQLQGTLTRESLIEIYPRMQDFNDRLGWSIWTSEVRGYAIEGIIDSLAKTKLRFNFAGLTYDNEDRGDGQAHPTNIRVHGEPISLLRKYRVAFPEGIALGTLENRYSFWEKPFYSAMTNTHFPLWTAFEQYLRKHPETFLASQVH